MSKTLVDRLEDIENEIHVLLACQESELRCGCQKPVKAASMTDYSDGNKTEVAIKGKKKTEQEIKKTPSSGKSSRPTSSPEASRRKGRRSSKGDQQGDGKLNETQISSSGGTRNSLHSENKTCCCASHIKDPPCICGQKKKFNPSKCICGPGFKSGIENEASDEQENEASDKQENEASDKQEIGASDKQETGASDKQKIGASNKQEIEALAAQLKESDLLTANLQSKLDELQRQMLKCAEEKRNAITASNEFKDKYEKLRSGGTAGSKELEKLKKEKDELTKQVEKQEEFCKKLDGQVKEATEKANKSVSEKVEKIEKHADKSTKKARQHNNNLTSAVKQKDNHIRKLSGTGERLADTMKEKEAEYKRLLNEHRDMIHNLLESQYANRKLADNNTALVKSIKEFQDRIYNDNATVQKLQQLIANCKEESKAALKEVEHLKGRLKQLLNGPKEMNELARLQEQLREAREREQKLADGEAELNDKVKQKEENKNAAAEKAKAEISRMKENNKKLQARYDELLQNLTSIEAENRKIVENMEAKMNSFAEETKAKHAVILNETAVLQKAYTDLTISNKKDKKAIQNNTKLSEEHEKRIQSQLEDIAAKDEKIKAAEAKITTLKAETAKLSSQVQTLQASLEQAQAETAAAILESERIMQQIEKIQQESLEKDELLKKLMADLKEAKMKEEALQRELRTSMDALVKVQEENTTLEVKTETAQGEKQIVKNKLVQMEATVNELCRCSVDKSSGDDGTTQLVNSLEQKINLLQRELELKVELIQKQKDQALKAAEFATTKLMETVLVFHEQAKTHKKVQYMLTTMLEDKKADLDVVCPDRCFSKKDIKETKVESKGKICKNKKCVNFSKK